MPALDAASADGTADPRRRERASAILAAESERFAAARPRSRAAARPGLAGGVPMHWMDDWPTPFPLVIAGAEGAALTDLDGHRLVDLCLGDTAAMFGHAPPPIRRALAGADCLSAMLPSADAGIVGAALAERFGLPAWQVATTASEANRSALRVARAATGRERVLVFDGCYHGAVDEALVAPAANVDRGGSRPLPGLIGAPAGAAGPVACVPFNDIPALAAALAPGDVACVLTEPALTNCGMVLPEAGFHATLRTLTRAAGTLLILDETHTLSAGPGGCTRRDGLDPDMLVVGKAIGGGIPVAVWGMTEAVADAFATALAAIPEHGRSGLGTTLSGSALQLACLRASLTEVMTEAAFARMLAGGDRLERALAGSLARWMLPWHVARLGARLELVMAPAPLRDAAAARAAADPTLVAALHLALLNRGVLTTPFHMMLLASPVLTNADLDAAAAAFDSALGLVAEAAS